MTRKLIRLALVGGLLAVLIALATTPIAQAQDFDALMAQAATTNQEYVGQIGSALAAPDLAILQAQTRLALATGRRLESLLTAAEAAATDDAGRSRSRGLLDHVQAAQAAGQRASSATRFDVARSAVDALRGEAVEAVSELRPFAALEAPQARPSRLPGAGSPGLLELLAVCTAGLGLVGGGLGLRRLRLV